MQVCLVSEMARQQRNQPSFRLTDGQENVGNSSWFKSGRFRPTVTCRQSLVASRITTETWEVTPGVTGKVKVLPNQICKKK